MIRQDPFGNKAHFIKPVLPFSKGWFCAAGVGAWSHTLQQTPPPTLFIPKKKKGLEITCPLATEQLNAATY